jgi:hypothetical protein
MTPSGIESPTFRLVPQYLKQLRYRLPPLLPVQLVILTVIVKYVNV